MNSIMKQTTFTILILLMINSCSCISHSKSSNELKVAEEGYINWVKSWGSLKHTPFQEAKNKLKPCKTIKVHKKSKKGGFTSIQQAINSIPIFNQCRVVIYVAKGTYREKVEIPSTMAYITIQGASMKKTIIVWDDTANRTGNNGKPLGTYGSATFAVNSPYFIAKNITFKNKAPIPRSGELGKQAVAMRISADTAAFIHCKFIGSQDTLYDHQGRHYFKNCHIQGSVDFIFGNGLSLYEGCHLHAKTNAFGALTAQKRIVCLKILDFPLLIARLLVQEHSTWVELGVHFLGWSLHTHIWIKLSSLEDGMIGEIRIGK
ncbi:hypothetical protein Leryth_006808 [Lithospermum erythrorhizon]|nr:hypothetical protein Leryth_006808 [Lithospermum erythrorhizon]